MTLDTLFLLVVPIYLVLVVYGQVGSRKHRLSGQARFAAAALRVIVPPLALAGALWSTGDAYLLAMWWPVVAGMALAGAVVALLVEVVAPKIGA